MEIGFLVKGIIMGFSIAAPVGPIGVLCIQRTLTRGRLSGFLSGLGAATADGFYGAVAAFGITFISNIFTAQQLWFRLIGGLFLLYLGIRTFISKPVIGSIHKSKTNLFSDYFSTVVLTITNPTTIFSFIAVFAGFGLGNVSGNFISAAIMVVGVILGSALWWFLLSGGVSLFRARFTASSLNVVNWISGMIIMTFGIIALVSLIR